MCGRCLNDRGIDISRKIKEEERPILRVKWDCAKCEKPFSPVNGESICAPCGTTTVVSVAEDYLKVLELDERPVPIADGLPLWKRLDKKAALEYAAELAADMETGFYVPEGSDKAWPEGRRLVFREIMRRMGYSDSYSDHNRKPAWFPQGGMPAFRGYVDWKKYERSLNGKIRWDQVEPYVEAVTFAGFSEIAKRIKLDPEKIPFRDLAQFTMRGMDMMKAKADPFHAAISAEGADAWAAISDALDSIGDDTAKRQIAGVLQGILAEAQKRTRNVIEIEAKAG